MRGKMSSREAGGDAEIGGWGPIGSDRASRVGAVNHLMGEGVNARRQAPSRTDGTTESLRNVTEAGLSEKEHLEGVKTCYWTAGDKAGTSRAGLRRGHAPDGDQGRLLRP